MDYSKIKERESTDYSQYSFTKGAILIDDDHKDKAIETLKEAEVPHRYFPTPLDAFYFEEAKFRMHGDYDLSELTADEIDELADEISDAYFNDDYILDGDALNEITAGIVSSYLKGDEETEENIETVHVEDEKEADDAE